MKNVEKVALDLVEPKVEMNSESEERFYCENCGKNYMRKRHLQRHIRDECVDVDPRFSCKLCEAKFRRKYHLVRHLSSRHGLSSNAAQAVATEGTMRGRTTGGGGGGNASSSRLFMYKGMPQNLSMAKKMSGKMKSKDSSKNRKKPLSNGELKPELLSDANGNQQLTNGVGVGVGVGGGLVLGGAAADAYRRSVEAQALLSAAQLSSAGTGGGGNCRGASPLAAPPPLMGMCGLTDAINAISAAAALVDRRSPIHVGVPNNVTPPLAHNNSNIRTSPTLLHAAAAVQQASQQQQDQPQELRNYNNNESNVPLPGTATPAEDWSMKFNLQLISNTLLQDRLIKTMPFAYNSNNNSSNN